MQFKGKSKSRKDGEFSRKSIHFQRNIEINFGCFSKTMIHKSIHLHRRYWAFSQQQNLLLLTSCFLLTQGFCLQGVKQSFFGAY